METMESSKILKPAEVAKILTVSTQQVLNLFKSGDLPHIKISPARYGVYQHDLDAFLSARYNGNKPNTNKDSHE